MKKFIKKVLVVGLVLTLIGCSSEVKKEEGDNKIVVAATLDPHSKILDFAKELLEEKGYELEVVVLDNYYLFNKSLNDGEIDANYFQHVPFFVDEIEANGYEISNVAGIHIEPFGFYSKKIEQVSELEDGATIIISNSISDQGRILAILEKENIIKLKDGVEILNATINDISENIKNVKFREVNPELLTTVFEQGEGELVAINGNYALQVGLNPVKDAVILEQADQTNPYVNIIAVQKGNEKNEKILALIEVLKSEEVKEFILKTYQDGTVIPAE